MNRGNAVTFIWLFSPYSWLIYMLTGQLAADFDIVVQLSAPKLNEKLQLNQTFVFASF
jgi:hypothetical protein